MEASRSSETLVSYHNIKRRRNQEDGGSTASETVVSNHRTTRLNNPENLQFCFFSVETSNYE